MVLFPQFEVTPAKVDRQSSARFFLALNEETHILGRSHCAFQCEQVQKVRNAILFLRSSRFLYHDIYVVGV